MYNKVILVGNLTRDIELRYAQSGSALAKTAIATSRKYTVNGEKKEETMFVDITFFGRSAEIANQYLKKGSKILVEGRLMFEQWTDAQGQKRSKHTVTVELMQMLDTKGGNSEYNAPSENYGGGGDDTYSGMTPSFGGQTPPAAPSAPRQSAPAYQAPQAQQIPSYDVDEDDIPF